MKFEFMFCKFSCNVLIVLILWIIPYSLKAQILYSNSKMPLDGYSNISCGSQISDASLGRRVYYKNPALLDTSSAGDFNIAYTHQLTNNDISLGYQFKKIKNFNASMFLNSSSITDFIETDDLGNVLGKYGISSNHLGFLMSKTQVNVRLGISSRLVIYNLAGLVQIGNFVDFGAQFKHPSKDLKFAFSINNINLIIKNNLHFNSFMPLEINCGSSIKPKYMPVRIHFGFGRNVLKFKSENVVIDYSISKLGLYKGLLQTDILMHKHLSLLSGLVFYSNLQGSIEKSIALGLVYMNNKYGFTISNRKELRLYNILSFSLYIATK